MRIGSVNISEIKKTDNRLDAETYLPKQRGNNMSNKTTKNPKKKRSLITPEIREEITEALLQNKVALEAKQISSSSVVNSVAEAHGIKISKTYGPGRCAALGISLKGKKKPLTPTEAREMKDSVKKTDIPLILRLEDAILTIRDVVSLINSLKSLDDRYVQKGLK